MQQELCRQRSRLRAAKVRIQYLPTANLLSYPFRFDRVFWEFSWFTSVTLGAVRYSVPAFKYARPPGLQTDRIYRTLPSLVLFCAPYNLCWWNIVIIQSDGKVTQPIPETGSICRKINYSEIRKGKTSFLSDFRGERDKVWRISSKLSSLNTKGRPERFLTCTLPVSSETVHQTRFCRFICHRRIGKVSLISFWQVKYERDAR
jgi:hypothetical protein